MGTMIAEGNQKAFKSHFLARIGNRVVFVETGEVVFFSAKNKIVYLHSVDGKRYIVKHTLETLETILDPAQFFRLNRSAIVQFSSIVQIRPHLNSRLKIYVRSGYDLHELIVSRERVGSLRKWVDR